MSRLAHATYAARGFEKEKRELAKQAQHEIREAKRIQRTVGCTWTEALRFAASKTESEAELDALCKRLGEPQ